MKLMRYNDRPLARKFSNFDDFEPLFNRMFTGWPALATQNGDTWVPDVDIRENKDAYLVEADVPGMDKNDIHISVADNVLTIKGERKREEKKEGDGYTRYERQYGSFERSFDLPGGIDESKVTAEFKDGVLCVTIPKPEETKKKQIEVKVK